jgi:hypothetical protein
MNGWSKDRVRERVVEETKAFLPVFLYVWILLAVLGLHKSLVLSQAHIFERQGFAVVKALAFAKVLFLAEKTPLGRILAERPLIWPVLAKSALFGMVLLVIDLIEEWLIAKFLPSHAGADALDVGDISILLSTLGVMTAALIPFFGLRELSRVIGDAEMMKLFFKERSNYLAIPEAPREPETDDEASAAETPEDGQYYYVGGQYYYYADGQYYAYESATGELHPLPPGAVPPGAGDSGL